MIVTVDPISAIPALGMRLSAWLSVHLIASDYTTSGADPEFALFSYNFPETMGEMEREGYIKAVGDECKKLGVAIAGGHTGSYPGSGYTVIGSGTMLGFAKEGSYLTPAMSRPGDVIVMTKHAAIEATASLAASFPEFTASKAGKVLARKAAGFTRLCTTVEDSRAARQAGLGPDGVTSMHDATEGGVLGALDEMAAASGKSFLVDPDKIQVSKEAAEVCRAFGLDPLTTMGEGALLITCAPEKKDELLDLLRRAGKAGAQIGVVRKGKGLQVVLGGRARRYVPGPDRYWSAYSIANRRRLK
jgi:hydrogenase expression/formation protein HypE